HLGQRPAAVGDEDGPHAAAAQLVEEVGAGRDSGVRVEGGQLVAAAAPGPAGGGRLRGVGQVLVEDDAVGGQAVQGRRADPLVAVAAQVAGVEAAHGDDERSHTP